MSTPYLGEVRMFGGNFAPSQNALCQGQLMSIAQNTALFALLGTYYGGNGTTTFGLPDFRGRLAINQGQGLGLSNYTIGQTGGSETVTLLTTQMPTHNHAMQGNSGNGSKPTPGGNIPAALTGTDAKGLWVPPNQATGSPIPLNPTALTSAGGSQPHENRMPLLVITFIIALNGIFPSRG